MDILPLNFKVLRFCGAWEEPRKEKGEHRNAFKRFVSLCYRYTIVLLIYYTTICDLIQLLLTHIDVDDLADVLFMALSFLAMCLKYGNFLARKNEISALLDRFRSDACVSRNLAEKQIIAGYDRKAIRCTFTFMTISYMNGLSLLLAPLLNLEKRESLPLKIYQPYSVSGWIPYIATYCCQGAFIVYAILLNVSFDSLVYGFTLRTCGQIELLGRRITEMFGPTDSDDLKPKPNKDLLIGKCVRHHILLHELVRRIQSLFVWWIAILFFFSLVTLCTSIFRMSKKTLISLEFLSIMLYFCSMLFQIFFYCWYGNELQLKSKSIGDAAYSSNWTTATTRDRKSLLLVMMISQRGLMLSYYGVFALALHTFMWIIKTSYSAFNLLQQASQ